jgi:S1-C subfamily serine protease
MSICLLLSLTIGQQAGSVESKDFSKDAQTAALRATVKIVNLTANHEGSAVIVKQDKNLVYLLTAGHLARPGDKLEIRTFTAESYPKPANVYKAAEVLAANREKDIAVIRLATRDTMPGVLPLCPPKKVLNEKDFPGLSAGCSGGEAPVCQVETVRGKKSVRRPDDLEATLTWESTTAPAKGRSGGPLIDKRGFIIGVASGANDDQGYYTHIDEIHHFLKRNALNWLYEDERK